MINFMVVFDLINKYWIICAVIERVQTLGQILKCVIQYCIPTIAVEIGCGKCVGAYYVNLRAGGALIGI